MPNVSTPLRDSLSLRMGLLSFSEHYDCSPYVGGLSQNKPQLWETGMLCLDYQHLEALDPMPPLFPEWNTTVFHDSLRQARRLINMAREIMLYPASAATDSEAFLFSREQQSLLSLQTAYNARPRKSVFLAGLLSAAVPGLGKAYAGQAHQFIPTLLPTLILGGQTLEAALINGTKDPRFWIFGSLTGVLYLGNIYSSAISVKQLRKHAYLQLHRDVLDIVQRPVWSLVGTK